VSSPDKRNVTPPLSQWRFWLYICVVSISGAGVIVASMGELSTPRVEGASLFVVVGLLVLVELVPMAFSRSRYFQGTSYPMMFIFALLLHWGLAGVALAIIVQVATAIVTGFRARKVLWRTVFNITQYALCLGAGYLCLLAFGISGSMDAPAPIDALTLPALLVAGTVALLINTILVGTSISLHLGTSWWHEAIVDVGSLAPLNDGASIAMAPLVVLAAERSPWLVPLLLVPLFALYKENRASLALKHQAGHDALTALPNRTQLRERAEEILAGAAAGSVVGLFVIDLDRFKEINDTLGHRAGDSLLQVVGDRLSTAVRPTDLVARLGGDEFAVLLPDLADEPAALAVAARIINAIRQPMEIEGQRVNVDASLGIALAPDHGADFETLLQHADLAMYAVKPRGPCHEAIPSASNTGASNRVNIFDEVAASRLA